MNRHHADIAAMILDDLTSQVETYTCCLACGLGGEEGVVDVAEVILLYTCAVITHFQDICRLRSTDSKRHLGDEW